MFVVSLLLRHNTRDRSFKDENTLPSVASYLGYLFSYFYFTEGSHQVKFNFFGTLP